MAVLQGAEALAFPLGQGLGQVEASRAAGFEKAQQSPWHTSGSWEECGNLANLGVHGMSLVAVWGVGGGGAGGQSGLGNAGLVLRAGPCVKPQLPLLLHLSVCTAWLCGLGWFSWIVSGVMQQVRCEVTQ